MPPVDEPLSAEARDAARALRERGARWEPEHERMAAIVAEHAPALWPLVWREPGMMERVLSRPLEHPSDESTLSRELAAFCADPEDEASFRSRLRRYRHSAIVRIALREILRLADVDRTSAEMARLATVLIDAAVADAQTREFSRHGRAIDEDGNVVPLTVLGMGKLGGLELNLGSDVDLVFFYETDEGTVEGSDLTVHELQSRVARRAVRALSEVTADGFCFRVDLRLRPEGSRGPLVNSLASAERYYESWGRTWERAALLRARPIAGDRAFGARLLDALRPFVLRRSVDPSIAPQMAEMLARSRRELDVDLERDVKLGRGGIREAEFFVQTLQLVWGGRYPALAVPGTLDGLRRLRAAALVTDREAAMLEDAWALLRRVEHRIHVRTGYQTHLLPVDPAELARFASSLGYSSPATLEAALARARHDVESLFASLLPSDAEPPNGRWDALLDLIARGKSADELAPIVAAELPVHDPFEAASQLVRLARRAGSPLGPVTRERTPELGRMLLDEVASVADPDSALRHLADFFTRLGGPWPYERLLLEEPRLTRRLIALFGASGTLAGGLVGHPESIDLLLTSAAPPIDEIAKAHERLADQLEADPDPERVVAELRRLKRELTLQVGLAYAAGEIDLNGAAQRLSELAEGQARVALEAATRWAVRRWGRPDPDRGGLVVCAMGKLGARELGFGGDLDLVFLYGADGETSPVGDSRTTTHAELFARIAQRTMMLLREQDAEGPGYQTDTRLRPSGRGGTLVASLASFDAYHARQAAAWERQALLRARPIAGDPRVAAEAEARFVELAYFGGPPSREELAHTRARIQVELAGESADRYHPKLGHGGLVDIEFFVQWHQMRHGNDERVRTPNTGAAIDGLAAAGVFSPIDADTLREGHAFFRAVEQSLKLGDEHREPMLEPRGRSGAHVARAMGMRARDGMDAPEVLAEAYRRQANAIRALFERKIAPVDARAPWEGE